MEGKNATWTVNSSQANNSSQTNDHYQKNSIYVFTPAGDSEKLILCLILSTLGITGFLGNCSIFYFLSKIKKKNGIIQSNPFVRSLNLYIRSLSLSDLLTCAVGAPLLCINISFDVFQSSWPCKTARYLQFIFPVATINTLVVTSLEKFLSTRKVLQRPMSTRKVRNIILCAWLMGLLLMLPASAAYDGIRVDLNNSHFTVICKNNEHFYPFRLTLIILPIQYVLPSVFVFFVNVHLSITLWNSIGRRSVAIGVTNSLQAHLRAKKIKGTTLLVALTFGSLIPFSFFVGNIAYTQIAKPQRNFSTSYMFRYGSAILVFLSPMINFTIFFSQMNDFRQFLKKILK